MRARTILALLAASVVCTAMCRLLLSADNVPAKTPEIVYTSARHYEANAWLRGGERFPTGATVLVGDGRNARPLVSGFAASADPNVSFDGKRVLFAGRQKAGDPWQIWEVAVDGGAPRRVVSTAEDAIRPFYLPEERLVYARKYKGEFVLEAASLDGKDVLQLTYAPGSALPSDVLRDGRILFTAGEPIGSARTPEIYTVYSDGSGVESYRCDHGRARYAARQVSSGDVVFTEGSALARFTSPLAHETSVVGSAGEYAGDIADDGRGEWLLPWRASAKANYEIKRLNSRTGEVVGVAADLATNLLQPVILAPRPVPSRHPSALHDWKYANLLTLNAYTSKTDFPEGSIAVVRVYTLQSNGKPKLLGKAPVEKDGSLYVRVPGNVPLQLELQDSSGKTLKKQAGWFWARAGEQRVCVGCHAGPEHAPDNAVPAVLLKSTVPADMTAR